jgi:hypothetical protein
MKKLILAFALAIMFTISPVLALDWHTANQVTVAWDPSEKIADTDVISYVLYLRVVGTETPIKVGETADTQYVVTFTEEGKYYLGVSAKRLVADGESIESDINWSDVNGESTPNPFGVKFYAKPNQPKNLHRP